MRKTRQSSGERIVKDIKRKTRKQYSAEESERSAIGSRNSEPVLCWMACAARKALQSSADEKVYPKAYIIDGRRIFLRPVRNDSLGTLFVNLKKA